MRSVVARLADARDYACLAADYVKGVTFSDFASDAQRQQAVCFYLLILGEACTEAAKKWSLPPAGIPWAEIKGMRNILVHEYWQIDEEIVYNVALKDTPLLIDRLGHLINELQ